VTSAVDNSNASPDPWDDVVDRETSTSVSAGVTAMQRAGQKALDMAAPASRGGAKSKLFHHHRDCSLFC
jgi:hypothetical protein